MFFISWQGLGFFKAAPELHKDGEGPSRLPHNGSREKGRRQQSRSPKDRLQVMLEECKAELTALCEQYCAQEGWRPPSGVVYKKAHKAARRKVDHPSAKIWDADDLSSGVESDSEGAPVNNRSPRDSPSTVDGLPREWKPFLSTLLPHLHRYFV